MSAVGGAVDGTGVLQDIANNGPLSLPLPKINRQQHIAHECGAVKRPREGKHAAESENSGQSVVSV